MRSEEGMKSENVGYSSWLTRAALHTMKRIVTASQ